MFFSRGIAGTLNCVVRQKTVHRDRKRCNSLVGLLRLAELISFPIPSIGGNPPVYRFMRISRGIADTSGLLETQSLALLYSWLCRWYYRNSLLLRNVPLDYVGRRLDRGGIVGHQFWQQDLTMLHGYGHAVVPESRTWHEHRLLSQMIWGKTGNTINDETSRLRHYVESRSQKHWAAYKHIKNKQEADTAAISIHHSHDDHKACTRYLVSL